MNIVVIIFIILMCLNAMAGDALKIVDNKNTKVKKMVVLYLWLLNTTIISSLLVIYLILNLN